MGERSAAWLASIAVWVTGCGGASLVLKEPIASQCSSTGLQGCPELADGILEYVDGDKDAARRKVIRAAAANSPAQVKAFTKAVRALGSTPGASEFMAPVLEVVALLEADAARTPTKEEDAGEDDEAEDSGAEAKVAVVEATGEEWEYWVETFDRGGMQFGLANLGSKRWELVAVTQQGDEATCVLKRRAR